MDTGSYDCTIRASIVIENDFKILRVRSDLPGFGNSGNVIKSHGVIRESLTVNASRTESIMIKIVPDDAEL